MSTTPRSDPSLYSSRLAVATGVSLLAALLAGSPALAADPEAASHTTSPIVVTATRLATPAREIASSMSVITSEEIEHRQYPTLVEALTTVPGLSVVRQGGLGRQTTVFIRGAEGNHTLVLIDGVEMNDPGGTDGAFDFADLPTDQIERVEVLRGPQGTLYGSDSIGGVINIITKRGAGEPRLDIATEAGSFKTHKGTGRFSGGDDLLSYSLSVVRIESSGDTLTPDRARGATADDEADEYRNVMFSGRVGLTPVDNLDIDLIGRWFDVDKDNDNSPEDPNSTSDNEEMFFRAETRLSLFDGLVEQRLGGGYTKYDRFNLNEPDAVSAAGSVSSTDGIKLKFDWQGDLYLTDDYIFSLGIETEEEKMKADSLFTSGFTSSTSAEARTNAAFVQAKLGYDDRLFGTLGARLDDHELAGSKVTYRATAAYLLPETGTKLSATLGTGFKAPALFELFASSSFFGFIIFNGNPNLEPEESIGWDVGIEQSLFDERLSFGATYFQNDIESLIVSSDDFTTVVNLDESETYGVESFVAYRVTDSLTGRLDYTFLRADDAGENEELLRRPKHRGSLRLDYTPFADLWLTSEMVHTGRMADIDGGDFSRIDASAFTITNVAASYALDETWRITGRIDNLFDQSFENPDRIKRPGIAGYLGLAVNY